MGALPTGDYYAIVSRSHRRPRADVYAWTLRHRLPEIPVPLKQGDPDVSAELQSVVDTVYDRARYDLSIDYKEPPEPPLLEADAEWAKQLVTKPKA